MFWAHVGGSKILDLFKVNDGSKINKENYDQVLNKMFFEWLRTFKIQSILVQNIKQMYMRILIYMFREM